MRAAVEPTEEIDKAAEIQEREDILKDIKMIREEMNRFKCELEKKDVVI